VSFKRAGDSLEVGLEFLLDGEQDEDDVWHGDKIRGSTTLVIDKDSWEFTDTAAGIYWPDEGGE
jgi:hypothetical protein